MTIDKVVRPFKHEPEPCQHTFAYLEQVSDVQPYTNLGACMFCGLSVAIEHYNPLENFFFGHRQVYRKIER